MRSTSHILCISQPAIDIDLFFFADTDSPSERFLLPSRRLRSSLLYASSSPSLAPFYHPLVPPKTSPQALCATSPVLLLLLITTEYHFLLDNKPYFYWYCHLILRFFFTFRPRRRKKTTKMQDTRHGRVDDFAT